MYGFWPVGVVGHGHGGKRSSVTCLVGESMVGLWEQVGVEKCLTMV